MSITNVILKNTLILLIAQAISMGLGVVFTVYMARYLEAGGLGLLSFALAFASAFAIFGDFGLGTLTTREVARAKDTAGKYLGNVIAIKLALLLVTFGLIVLAVNLLGYPERTANIIYVVALSIVFTSFTQAFNSIFQAYEKMEYQSIGAILSSVLMLAGALLVVRWGLGVMEFALTYLAANAIVTAYSLAVCSWKLVLPRPRLDVAFSKTMLLAALPFGLSLMAGVVYSNLDSILLSSMKGYEAAGWYNAAYRLVAMLVIIPGMVNIAVYPAMARFHVSSRASLERITEKYFKLMLLASLPIGVGTTFLAEKAVGALFGPGYAQSAVALQILVWATIFTFIGAAYIRLCESTDRQLLVAKLLAACVAINLAANLLLIPGYSYIGSGIARLISELFMAAAILYLAGRMGYDAFNKSVRATALKAVLGCVVMGAFLAAFNGLDLAVLVAVAPALYLLTLLATGGIDKEYIDGFKSIVFERDVVDK